MVVTAAEMRSFERRAIEEFGVSSRLLMENAGQGLAEMVLCHQARKSILVVCGKGNNAGDGFVAARHLMHHGRRVTVALAADPDELKGDARFNYQILKKQTSIVCLHESTLNLMRGILENHDTVIDALLGIGLNAPIEGILAEIVKTINSSGLHTIAADIPSGIHADSGKILGIAIQADQTGTFGLMKAGLTKGEGPSHAGLVEIIDIGLPKLPSDQGS